MGPGTGLDLAPRSPLNSVQMPAKANKGRSSLRANHTTSFFFVSGFGSGAYSAKLFAATRQCYDHACERCGALSMIKLLSGSLGRRTNGDKQLEAFQSDHGARFLTR